jgi:hypothetical protein
MLNSTTTDERSDLIFEEKPNSLSRRKFFGIMGASSALMVAAASCKKFPSPGRGNTVDLGSGDTGILNYAYALEQLEAAFYIKVIANPYGKMSEWEKGYLTDVRDHEIAHREFFKAALGSSAIQQIQVDFSSVDFYERSSVLNAAKAFEDLGVSAYNGAGQLITNPAYLTLAGKIVSVEARHAALIRDLLSPDSFADMTVVNAMGLDQARTPNEVLAMASPFLKTKLDASHLPTS